MLRQGPLASVRVLEFAGIGPGPHVAMLLANLGAEVLRVERPGGNGYDNPIVDSGLSALTIDIRTPEGRARCLDLAALVDVVIEGSRPGVMERLGLGPEPMLDRNPRIVYGRMTGWGQTGPLAHSAGHDINYIALTGALAAIGGIGQPAQPPLNLVGDFGGGSLYLAFGIMAALFERERSGKGQVIDAAIVDGVSSLMTFFSGLVPSGAISLDREKNMLGGAAPFYRCYLCADGTEISIGAIEPKFYAELIDKLGLDPGFLRDQNDARTWPQRSAELAAVFATKTRAEWCALLEGSDACFAPVLTLEESFQHPHMRERAAYIEAGGHQHAAPAPRFSRTPGAIMRAEPAQTVLQRWQQR
ncbi:MAG TPA: CaiB/BaiF CoA-transferase family protein [Polyangiales bacterium]|nr:CaiB/BaiF CoA-transferase family protein [Polyangiales bacterium]